MLQEKTETYLPLGEDYAMTVPPPAEVGMHIDEVDTPALLIDLDIFEDNLRRMADAIKGTSVRLRAHSKTHKCPEIARLQIALGGVGQCCQKVSEAEVMVAGGIGNVIVTNEVIGARKLKRLAMLARRADVAVCCDDPKAVASLDEAAAAAGVRLRVLVEIDVGAHRCGLPPGEAAVALAKLIAEKPNLRFGGLQAYHGSAQHQATYAQRKASIAGAIEATRLTRDMLAAAGLECDIIGGAGTGTFRMETASGVFNEIQAGSYIFMDGEYAAIEAPGGTPFEDFRQSLFILTTVMSHPGESRAICDAGIKAASPDKGLPKVFGETGVTYVGQSDEHGVLALKPGHAIQLGSRIRLIPSHCDPTVNLHNWYVCHRGTTVEAVWPIAARGMLF